MGGQFWSAFISCKAQFHDAVQLFLEQIDVIRQMVAKYPDDLMWAVSSDDIQTAISGPARAHRHADSSGSTS